MITRKQIPFRDKVCEKCKKPYKAWSKKQRFCSEECRGLSASLKSRFLILHKFNFSCQYCGRKAPEVVFHIDHIYPRSKGGKSIIENYTLACDDCNLGKGNLIL